MRDFDALTPIGQVRRLRAVAARALQEHRLLDYRLTLAARSFNTVFRVETAGATYALRVGPLLGIHAAGVAQAEDTWTQQLTASGFSAPRIVRAPDGSSSVFATDEPVPGDRECTLLTWTPGRAMRQPLTPEDVRDLAVLSANLHDASVPQLERPAGTLDGRRALHLELPDLLDELPEQARSICRAALNRAQGALDELWRHPSSQPRVIHSDLTPSNALRERGPARLGVIDFQDLTWGHLEQDLANTIFAIARAKPKPSVDLAETLDEFREQYQRVRSWPALDHALLVDLAAARRLEMVNLAIARKRPGLAEYIGRHATALERYVT